MNEPRRFLPPLMLGLAILALAAAMPAVQAQSRDGTLRPGDYIVAVVNSELVTAGEVQQRVVRAQQESARSGARLPPNESLRKQIVDALIDDRVQVTYARDSGVRVDDSEVDRAIANVAVQNQVSLQQLKDRLWKHKGKLEPVVKP